jgi:hypothetical protein
VGDRVADSVLAALPDVARLGGLAAAFGDLATVEGIDLGVIEAAVQGWARTSLVPSWRSTGHRGTRPAEAAADRGVLAARRRTGNRPDTGPAHHDPRRRRFLEQARLADLSRRFPFMSVSELGRAFAAGNRGRGEVESAPHPRRRPDATGRCPGRRPHLRSLFPYSRPTGTPRRITIHGALLSRTSITPPPRYLLERRQMRARVPCASRSAEDRAIIGR